MPEGGGALKIEAKEKRDWSATNLIYGFPIALKNERDKEKEAEKEIKELDE